jgi:hypothetical protein
MTIIKISWRIYADICKSVFFGCTLAVSSMLLLLSFLQTNNLFAAVDIDVSGNGRAAAYDGEESVATDGDSFCSITNDIAGGMFSSLFEGIVGDCDNDGNDSQIPNQFLIKYSYSKNPVKIGEKTYIAITVKDKETGRPVPDAFVTFTVDNKPSSSRNNMAGAGLAAAAVGGAAAAAAGGGGIPANPDTLVDKATHTAHTDSNGYAAFTVQLGPKSDMGIYDTEIKVSKDEYQSILEQADLRVQQYS